MRESGVGEGGKRPLGEVEEPTIAEEKDGEENNAVDKAQELVYDGSFDMSSVKLPAIGEVVDYPGSKQSGSRDGDSVSQNKLTVKEALGRHGKPLRSRLFEVGYMFEPTLSTGHNFVCCVPVLDEVSGTYKPCNAVLKIPKGSLGNPFRHLRNKHPDAYKCIMDQKGQSSKERSQSASAPSKKKQKVSKDKGEGAAGAAGAAGLVANTPGGSGEEELPVESAQKLSKKLSGKKEMLRKCVIFCCLELLPLDEINKEGFKYFLPNIYNNASTDKTTAALYKILKAARMQLNTHMQERLEEAQKFYRGLPFIHVSVSPEVIKTGPLVRLLFINSEGNRMEINLLEKSTELVEACRNHSDLKENIAVVAKAVESLGHQYQLEITASNIASVSFEGNTAWTAGDVDISFLQEYLDPNKKGTTSSSSEWVVKELQKYVKPCTKGSGSNLVLSKEIDVYDSLKQDLASEGESVAGFWREHAAELELLFTVVCSLKYGSSESKMQEQTEREKTIIEKEAFLSEGIHKIVKPMDVPFYIESVLLMKYNASMLL